MATSISALVPTVIKRFTIDSTELAPTEQFELEKGEKIGVNWIRTAARDDHWEFELKSPKGGFFSWYAFKSHNPPLTQPDGAGPASSQVMAMLDVIARTEGTDRSIGDGLRTGYDVIFTFDRFTDFSDHPRRIRCSGSLCSDAAGRYQFLSTTWDGLRLPDFQPAQQDLGACRTYSHPRFTTDALKSAQIPVAAMDLGDRMGHEKAQDLPPLEP